MTGVLIGLVGDLLINRDRPDEVFKYVTSELRSVDLLFGNLEGAYTNDPRPVPGSFPGCSAPAHCLSGIESAGFGVLSLANNHILDVGAKAMLETREALNRAGIATCGAGITKSEAHKPAIVEANGLRIAFLAYSSVFPIGYEARTDAPGLAPMRGYNFWRDPYPGIHVPGKTPVTETVPDPGDLELLTKDIECARSEADLVFTSFHWGDYSRPFHLTDHERRIARHAIDSGANLVVGHHHHALRGVEWYEGSPILYGLGHFVFDLLIEWTDEQMQGLTELMSSSYAEGAYSTAPREGWPFLPMHEDTRMTVLAWAKADKSGVSAIGFLPCRLHPDGTVRPTPSGSDECAQTLAYLDRCNSSQGLNARIVPDPTIRIGDNEAFRVQPRA